MLCVVCDTFFGPQNTFSTAHVSIGQNFEHEWDFQHDRAIFCSLVYGDIHLSCSSLPRISLLRRFNIIDASSLLVKISSLNSKYLKLPLKLTVCVFKIFQIFEFFYRYGIGNHKMIICLYNPYYQALCIPRLIDK